MDINKDYILGENSFFDKKFKKKQIIIGNTFNTNMDHFDVWKQKISGKYKKTATYTVTLDGKICEHFDPAYYSNFLNCGEFDKKIISIVLENEGWLIKDFELDNFVNWSGDVYNRSDALHKQSWRGKNNWAPYSDKQINSLVSLCNYLIDNFDIERYVSPDNIKIKYFTKKNGIYYRSNYSKNMLDVSPAFNIDYFKSKIEK